VNVQHDHDELLRQAAEYAEDVTRTGSPEMRPAMKVDAMRHFLRGVKAGIAYEQERREQQS
jgi:hypothetical protein